MNSKKKGTMFFTIYTIINIFFLFIMFVFITNPSAQDYCPRLFAILMLYYIIFGLTYGHFIFYIVFVIYLIYICIHEKSIKLVIPSLFIIIAGVGLNIYWVIEGMIWLRQ